MKILFYFLISINLFAESDYTSGPDYCKDIQLHENGKWIDVPVDYSKRSSGSFKLYYWFLGGKYDKTKPTIIKVNGGPGATSHYYHSLLDKVADQGFNIVFFDQRGYVCSRPADSKLQDTQSFYSLENTSNDMEKIRKSMGLTKWTVYGSSFGSPIVLKYTNMFPNRTISTVIDGPAAIDFDWGSFSPVYLNKIVKFARNSLPFASEVFASPYDKMYKDLIEVFSNIYGVVGINEINKRLNSSGTYDDLLNSLNSLYVGFEDETLIDEIFYQYSNSFNARGKYVYQNAEDFIWEDSDASEYITMNDEFKCIMEFEAIDCVVGSEAYEKTFKPEHLSFSSPVFFFKGFFDGSFSSLINLNKTYKDKGMNSYVIELEQNSHGPLYDTSMFGTQTEKLELLKILTKAFKGKNLTGEDLEVYNSNGVYSAKIH